MLVLSRKLGEKVRIGDDIDLVILEVKGNRVRIGLSAPAQVHIVRQELLEHFDRPPFEEVSRTREILHAAGNR